MDGWKKIEKQVGTQSDTQIPRQPDKGTKQNTDTHAEI